MFELDCVGDLKPQRRKNLKKGERDRKKINKETDRQKINKARERKKELERKR